MTYHGLIADIGATNARFALADDDGFHHVQVLKCEDFENIADAAEHYLHDTGTKNVIKGASVAIAGPVKGDEFKMTNHPWVFSVSRTKARLNLDFLHMMNDFEAVALSIPHLKAGDDYRQIGEGKAAPRAPIGIIGPGTGLGVASLAWDGCQYRALPGEGGHVTMPAKTQREFDVFQWLIADKYHHISAERVCSGKGLYNVYRALRGLDKLEDAIPMREPEEISKAALSGECKTCVEALDMMCGFLGNVAGNLALTLGAFGGIYIAGGIPAKLGDYFDQSRFRDEFLSKGRFADYLAAVPTNLITNEYPAFVGLHADLIKSTAGRKAA